MELYFQTLNSYFNNFNTEKITALVVENKAAVVTTLAVTALTAFVIARTCCCKGKKREIQLGAPKNTGERQGKPQLAAALKKKDQQTDAKLGEPKELVEKEKDYDKPQEIEGKDEKKPPKPKRERRKRNRAASKKKKDSPKVPKATQLQKKSKPIFTSLDTETFKGEMGDLDDLFATFTFNIEFKNLLKKGIVKVEEFLQNNTPDFTAVDSNGFSYMHHACMNGKDAVIDRVLKEMQTKDLNKAVSKMKLTELHMLCQHKDLSMIIPRALFLAKDKKMRWEILLRT